jgi:hypothetical protein
MGIEARQAAAQRSISAVGTVPSGNNTGGGGGGNGKRTRGGRGGGSNKKQKGVGAGGQSGQQSEQPKFAAQDNPDVEIHAGYYPPKLYRSLSKKQLDAVKARRKEKKKNKKDGSNIGAVVVAKSPVAAEPGDGVVTDLKEGESPDESPTVDDPATVADNSGAPADDKDSVIAVEDTKPAAISFGHAAYAKKPVPEKTQLVAAVAVTAKPVAKPKPEPRGPMERLAELNIYLARSPAVTGTVMHSDALGERHFSDRIIGGRRCTRSLPEQLARRYCPYTRVYSSRH